MSLGLAIAGGTAIALAPLLVTVFGRDPDANHHDLSDYHQPTPDNDPRPSCTHEWHGADGGKCPDCGWDAAPIPTDILPPAPPGTKVSLRLYAEQVVAEQLREQYGTTNHATIAAAWLRDLAPVNTVTTGGAL